MDQRPTEVSASGGGGVGGADARTAVESLVGWLSGVRARARLVLVGSKAATLLAGFIGAAIALGLIDYALRLPGWLRFVLWGAGLGAAGWYTATRVLAAWRFRPSLTDVALRVERAAPEFKGRLASAVDFARHGDASRIDGGVGTIGQSLAQTVVRRTAGEWGSARRAVALISGRPLARRSGWLGGALALCLLLLAASPALWGIGAARVLMPWSDTAWPKRTAVIDATNETVHPLGTALALRAALVRSTRAAESTTVSVRYRTVTGGVAGPVRRELLTWQGQDIAAGEREGALFERLVEPSGDAIEYRFETEDDATEWASIRLIEPPAVLSARATITPPAYAAGVLAARLEQAHGEEEAARLAVIDLGPGTDERAVAPASLAGSLVELRLTLNRALPVPDAVRDLFGDEALVEHADDTWRARWTLNQSLRLPVRLVDEHGIASVEEAVYRFEATEDRPAAATVTEPGVDRTVLPTAIIEVVGEGRDDVGLAWVGVEHRRFAPGGQPGERSGPGGAMEQVGEAVIAAREEGNGLLLRRVGLTLDLSTLELRAGDELRLTALALDLLGARAEVPEPTRSAARTLRIISETQLIEEIQRDLSEIRQGAIRLTEQQGELRERTRAGRVDSQTRRGQAQVGERLARQREQAERLRQRLAENRLDDRALDELLRGAARSVDQAGEASRRAAESLDRAQEAAAEGGEQGDAGEGGEAGEAGQGAEAGEGAQGQNGQAGAGEQPQEAPAAQQEAERAQEEVQDRLRELIEMLDRGEDNWVVRNTIERLLREQQELRNQTAEVGQRTAGREAQSLTPDERRELDGIVERQTRLAEDTQRLTDDMRQREERLSENDPAAAAAMRQAARRAEQEQVAQAMRQAAGEASQNQTSRAQQQQQRAEEALEEMLEDLEQGARARDDVLRRVLASVIESLDGLIRQQEQEIAALDARAAQNAALAGLDRGMIALHQNTLAVADLAQRAGAEAGPIATLIARAGEAQVAAIQELRSPLAAARIVRGHESRSLELLREAKARAEEADERAAQRQRDRKLAELKKVYREILEAQVALRQESEPLAGARELSRRDRVLLRGLGERQSAIGDRLRAVLGQSSELQEARVFEYAHRRLDEQSQQAVERLTAAEPRPALRAQQAVEEGIRRLLEAISDPPPDPSKFRDAPQSGQGGGSGGSQQQPLIPPLKELRLLRMLQVDIADRTRAAGEEAETEASVFEGLGRDQRDLMEVGREFLDRMEQQGGPAPTSGPEEAPNPVEPVPVPEEALP